MSIVEKQQNRREGAGTCASVPNVKLMPMLKLKPKLKLKLKLKPKLKLKVPKLNSA